MNTNNWHPFTLKPPFPPSAPAATRKEKQIPESPELRELQGAIAARHDAPHRYLVGSIKPGPQPCLVEVQRGNTTVILPELIIVPDGVMYSRLSEHEVYGKLLALLRHLCQSRLDDARKNKTFDSLTDCCPEDAPFRNVHWYKLLAAATELLGATPPDASMLPPLWSEAVTKLRDRVTELAECWEPHAFFIPSQEDLRGWASNKYLIEKWAGWEAARLTPTCRLRRFCNWERVRLPSDSKGLKTAIDTFRERWHFLRLECTVGSGARRGRSLWDVWLSEETA